MGLCDDKCGVLTRFFRDLRAPPFCGMGAFIVPGWDINVSDAERSDGSLHTGQPCPFVLYLLENQCVANFTAKLVLPNR